MSSHPEEIKKSKSNNDYKIYCTPVGHYIKLSDCYGENCKLRKYGKSDCQRDILIYQKMENE